jgi:hypothetical protein
MQNATLTGGVVLALVLGRGMAEAAELPPGDPILFKLVVRVVNEYWRPTGARIEVRPFGRLTSSMSPSLKLKASPASSCPPADYSEYRNGSSRLPEEERQDGI